MASRNYKIHITREFPLWKFPEKSSKGTITPGTYDVVFQTFDGEDWLVVPSHGYGAPTRFWAQWYERAWTQDDGGIDVLPHEER